MYKLSMDELKRATLDSFKKQQKLPIILVLDNIRSLHNVGSIFRTADCIAIEEIILCGITGQPPHREIEKTALGATQSVLWRYEKNTSDALSELKNLGYQLIAIEQVAGSIMLNAFKPVEKQKYALIFGNEVDGVSEKALNMVDKGIEIPQYGTKHSFNVVVSAGIVLWDFSSKLRQ